MNWANFVTRLRSFFAAPSSADTLRRAALANLYPLPSVDVYRPSPEKVAQARSRILGLRKWISTLPDKRVRRAHSGWMDYAERRVNEAEKEMLTGKRRRISEDYRRRRDAEMAAADAVAKTLPIPPQDAP